ncbi:DUF58 domain-containing protein [Leekyejoonella antrihumi]|uniref:DUF58 domain-containing protein n=1 Tax=Leekyejoonella antrihumi TaxID=1660198 RepID=A0A563DZY0_9MICO|nr:DUF58 domain-containing protein [Leekyejoonella antrihumi]TWP35194.1 DUF58 domain-containing protein [Leekyejoonella antrihumi]
MIRHRNSSLTQRGLVFISGGGTLAIGGIVLGYVDIARVGMLLVVLPLLTLLLSRRRSPDVEVTRVVEPATLLPDQRAQVSVTFRNPGRRATRLCLAEERIDYVLGDRPRFILPALYPGAARRLTYVVRSHVRGRHHLGPIRLRETDPFGLTTAAREIRQVDEVLVLPRVVPLGATKPPGSGVGSEGEVPQMIALHGAEDVSIRAYHDGDDLRKVHWPATAHRGELMVRQEEQPARRSAVLLLDSRASGHQGSGTRSSFEWAVSAAASIAVRLDELQYSTHLATVETLSAELIDAAAPAGDIVRWLAVAGPDEDLQHEVLVNHTAEVVRLGAIVVAVLTDLDDGRAAQLAGLRQAGAAGIALILDTHSFTHPNAETSLAADGLRGQLAGAGWRVVIVRGDTGILAAWATVSSRSLLRMGAL